MVDKSYYQTHKEQLRKYNREYRAKHPEKIREWNQNWMKKHGFRKRPITTKKQKDAYNYVQNHQWILEDKCEFCGETENLHGHHLDYDHPKIVVTCCSSCHAYIHRGTKETRMKLLESKRD